MDLIQNKLEGSRLRSPLDGIVSRLKVKEGVVLPSTRMMTVFQKGDYQVETFVLTEDAGILHPGMGVELVQSGRDKDLSFQGTVINVAPFAEEKISLWDWRNRGLGSL